MAEALPDTVLHSRADGTTKKYLYAFQRWRQWAGLRREVAVFPVQEVHFALYLQHLGETVQSKSAVEEAVNAVSWVHQISGLPAVTASPFVRATLSGLQRKLRSIASASLHHSAISVWWLLRCCPLPHFSATIRWPSCVVAT